MTRRIIKKSISQNTEKQGKEKETAIGWYKTSSKTVQGGKEGKGKERREK